MNFSISSIFSISTKNHVDIVTISTWLAGSPGRARTYNNSVNSRVLCHWATEEYGDEKGVCFCFSGRTSPFHSWNFVSSLGNSLLFFSLRMSVLLSRRTLAAVCFFCFQPLLSFLKGYKEENLFSSLPWKGIRRRPTLPGRLQPSTIGVQGFSEALYHRS